jgi:hypothetical protein
MPVPYARAWGVDRSPSALAVGRQQVELELERDLRRQAHPHAGLDRGAEHVTGVDRDGRVTVERVTDADDRVRLPARSDGRRIQDRLQVG